MKHIFFPDSFSRSFTITSSDSHESFFCFVEFTHAKIRGFNKFLHKWVLKGNRRVYLPKAQRAFDTRGVQGHAPPENFEVLDSRRCILRSFFVALLFHFFAPKSTNLNKFEENYVTMK